MQLHKKTQIYKRQIRDRQTFETWASCHSASVCYSRLKAHWLKHGPEHGSRNAFQTSVICTATQHLTETNSPWTVTHGWLQHAYSCPSFSVGDFDLKVGQTDLVFGVQSGFISRSVQTRLQVSVCSSYNLFHRCPYTYTNTETAF